MRLRLVDVQQLGYFRFHIFGKRSM